ncbi:MAG: BACON domain-containing protein [Alistipes sp.]|nr:BACON domain-containing protein [Alistipes sp.]
MLMKKIIYIVICSLVLIACSEDDSPGSGSGSVKESILLKVDSKIVIEQKSSSTLIDFVASGEWTANIDTNAESWCHIDRNSGGRGYNTITLTVLENDTYDERNVSLTIKCGNAKKILTITQKQKDGLIVTSNRVELGAEGGNFVIEVQSNVSVTYEIDEYAKDWITIGGSRALTSNMLTFNAKANESQSRRQGNIILRSSAGITENVTVYQEGESPCLVLTCDDSLMVDSDGGVMKIELRSNVEYELILPDVDWIDEAQTRSVSTYTHYLYIAPNVEYSSRQATLIVRSKDATLSDTLHIIQMQCDAIMLAKSNYNVGSEESDLYLQVCSNVNFVTDISVDWISRIDDNSTRSLVEDKVCFKVKKNPTEEDRVGTISFSYEDISQKVTICQDGRTDKLKIVLTHSEKIFSPLEFQGDLVSGNVDWGDGSMGGLEDMHTFEEKGEYNSTFEVVGVDMFQIKKLNTISSITIYYNQGKDGVIEDFDIENKDWD